MGDATGDDLGLVLGAATLLVATASCVVLACPARRKTPVLLSPLHVNGRSTLFRGGRYVSKAWLDLISSASAQRKADIGNVEIMMTGFCSFTATTRYACSHRIITRQNYDEAHHHFSSVSPLQLFEARLVRARRQEFRLSTQEEKKMEFESSSQLLAYLLEPCLERIDTIILRPCIPNRAGHFWAIRNCHASRNALSRYVSFLFLNLICPVSCRLFIISIGSICSHSKRKLSSPLSLCSLDRSVLSAAKFKAPSTGWFFCRPATTEPKRFRDRFSRW